MKVLILNGSPHPEGNTAIGLREAEKELHKAGIETEFITVGTMDVRGCIACGYCKEHGCCVFKDIVNELAPKFEAAAGLLVGSPVYYAQPNATITALLQRLFYSTHFPKRMKVGGSVACCRRGGASATFDALNKYFTICEMPVVSSTYWNSIHGRTQGEAQEDAEGLLTMRNLGRNMAFLMKAIQREQEENGLPEEEPRVATNFVR